MGKICFKFAKQERIYRINKFASKTLSIDHQDVIKNTRRWLEKIVVGLNQCPFSSSVIAQDQVYYAVSDATMDEQLKQSM